MNLLAPSISWFFLALGLMSLFDGAHSFQRTMTIKRGARITTTMNLEPKKKTNFGSFGVGGKVLFAIALGGFLKARFSTSELRTTTVCPSGPGSEVVLRTFKTNDPQYHCLPIDQLASKLVFSPLVFPGQPGWDPTPFQGARGLPFSTPISNPDVVNSQ